MNKYSDIIYNYRKHKLGLSQTELGHLVYGDHLSESGAQQRVSRVEKGKPLKNKEIELYENAGIPLRGKSQPIKQEDTDEMEKMMQTMDTKLDLQFGNINQALREITKEIGGFETEMRSLRDYVDVIKQEVNRLKKAAGQG